ncbi:fibronectin type III domain-containing protein [Micromonospora musae]|uniref:fibronectin type III domain-containing protein n=1 Tax=Micromonospora musae TaxID=1894970 RepID=UPI0033E4EF8B
MGISRRLAPRPARDVVPGAVRAAWELRSRLMSRRGRLPLVLLVGVALAAVTVAVSGAAAPLPGLHFAQGGHWVASAGLGKVFHVNGAARRVDAQASLGEIEAGSQVVQSDTSGYVVGRTRIVEFGKSSLSVESTMTPPTGERPVAVEVAGGPYLVYREAGRVVRLGEPPATIPAGGALGDPVAARDGTLWLNRLDSGVLCRLSAGTDRISCPAVAPTGHTGALTVVDGRPVFVDTAADTLSPVTDGGLGRPTPMGVDVPAAARVAPADVGGRVAILDPVGRRMHLVDAAGLDTGRADAPVSVALPEGTYADPSGTRSSVVLLDLKRNAVLTYNNRGEQQRVIPLPPENGEPALRRGEDERVYVDGAEGRHVLVVDRDGAVGGVPVNDRPESSRTPVPPPPRQDPTPPRRDPTPPRRDPPPRQEPPARDDANDGGPARPATGQRPVPASPPGMPGGLTASVRGSDVVVSWKAAAGNGAAVTGYQVRWKPASGSGGGSSTRAGSARSMTLTGLTRGVAYTITVVAQNSAGRGSPATARATVPAPTRTVSVSRGSDTTYQDLCDAPDCAFMRVTMRGFAPNTSYSIKPHSDEWPNYNPGTTLQTDRNGNLTFERFPFDDVGQHVWVTVAGLESNHYLWRAG